MIHLISMLALLLSGPAQAVTPGESLIFGGRLEEALPLVRDEARQSPKDLDAQERYIDLSVSMGMQHVVGSIYTSRLKVNPNDADAHYLLGRVLPDSQMAVEAYRMCLQLNPNHARAFMGLGAVYRVNGHGSDAVEAYRMALQRDPHLEEAWYGLTSTLVAQDRSREALEAARLAIVNLPGSGNGYLMVAKLAPKEAVATLKLGAQHASHDPAIHAALSMAALNLGEGDLAQQAALNTLRIAPGHIGAQLSLMFANALVSKTMDKAGYASMLRAKSLENTNPEAATQLYNTLVASYPRCELVWMGRARIRSVNEAEGAVADLRMALSIQPENPEILSALGLMLIAVGDDAGAILALERAVADRPYDVPLLIAVSKAAGRLDPMRGISRIEQAHRSIPDDFRLTLTYAQMLSAQGGGERAIDVLDSAARRVPDGRIGVALAAIAHEEGRHADGVARLLALANETGNSAFADTASALLKKSQE